jgi:uncharacterized membrane protein YeaQ/YmgE (transglycosylase-associated protein family)
VADEVIGIKNCAFFFAVPIIIHKFAALNQLNSIFMGIIYSLLLGCLAGFCAGKLMKGGGFGIIMNIVLGLFGGVLGGWLFSMLGIEWGGILGQLGTAIIGAVAILWVASFFKK